MAQRAFFTREARDRAAAAIADVEKQTSAEVVIVVHARAGRYRAAHLLGGAVLAFLLLLVLLFEPHSYDIRLMPLELVAMFVVGALLAGRVAALERVFTPAAWRREDARRAARAAFVDGGVSRTTGRNGVLVFVAMLERAVEVVPDVGVDPKALGAPWTAALDALTASVARGEPDYDAFLTAVRALGPVLGASMPRRDDDVNELPDVMETA